MVKTTNSNTNFTLMHKLSIMYMLSLRNNCSNMPLHVYMCLYVRYDINVLGFKCGDGLLNRAVSSPQQVKRLDRSL